MHFYEFMNIISVCSFFPETSKHNIAICPLFNNHNFKLTHQCFFFWIHLYTNIYIFSIVFCMLVVCKVLLQFTIVFVKKSKVTNDFVDVSGIVERYLLFCILFIPMFSEEFKTVCCILILVKLRIYFFNGNVWILGVPVFPPVHFWSYRTSKEYIHGILNIVICDRVLLAILPLPHICTGIKIKPTHMKGCNKGVNRHIDNCKYVCIIFCAFSVRSNFSSVCLYV